MHIGSNELRYLTFARFIFNARASTFVRLPRYKGSTFRGGFGYNLRRTVCINRKSDCERCVLRTRCIYTYVFETKPPEGSKTDVPHPYVLIPPDTEKEDFEPGEPLTFELVLFGRAIDYFPYFLFVFLQLGENGIGKDRGRFHIETVDNERFNNRMEIYTSRTGSLKGDVQIYSSENLFNVYRDILNLNPGEITIQLITPFRLKLGGKLRDSFTFFDFFRSFLNRLYLLTYFHCGNRFDRDHRELLELSKGVEITEKHLQWRDWTRYSTRQKTRMQMGGVVGRFTLKGELSPFLPFLKIGEFTHVGKATSMGLGRYKVEISDKN